MDILKHGAHCEVVAPQSLRSLLTGQNWPSMHEKYADARERLIW